MPVYGVRGWYPVSAGRGGGYRLHQDAASISIARIIDSVSESMDATRCEGRGDCQHGNTCLTHHLWCDLSEALYGFLDNISLADMLARRDVQEVAARQTLDQAELEQKLIYSSNASA